MSISIKQRLDIIDPKNKCYGGQLSSNLFLSSIRQSQLSHNGAQHKETLFKHISDHSASSQRCWFISQKIIHRTGRFQYSDSALVPRYTIENVKPNILLYVLQFGLFHKRFATFFQFHVWLRIPETTQKNWPLFHTAFSTTNIYWIIFSISFSVRAMRASKPSFDHASINQDVLVAL